MAIKLATGAAAAEALSKLKGERARAIRLLRRGVFTRSDEWRAGRGQEHLADLLADKGRWSKALELAKGKRWAQEWIPKRLALAGNFDALRTLADTGLDHAGRELAALLAEHGQYRELLDRTRKGDKYCAQRLAALAYDEKLPNGERLLAEGL